MKNYNKSFISAFQYASARTTTLRSIKAKTLSITLVGLLVSTVANADALGDLIAQKDKQFTAQASTTQHTVSQSPVSAQTIPQPVVASQSVNPVLPSSNGSASKSSLNLVANQDFHLSYANASNVKTEHINTLYNAEQNASPAGKKILQTVRKMALDDRTIISGSCWDYLNAAFGIAGVGREKVFKGSYPNGPFVNTNLIEAGDWLYYVNHSYNDIEHSGLFVGWLDRASNQALILSYAGGNRNEPARYKVYDVSHTYNIIRPY